MEVTYEQILVEYQSKVAELNHEILMLKAHIKNLENSKESK